MSQSNTYYEKYLKYKSKYNILKQLHRGGNITLNRIVSRYYENIYISTYELIFDNAKYVLKQIYHQQKYNIAVKEFFNELTMGIYLYNICKKDDNSEYFCFPLYFPLNEQFTCSDDEKINEQLLSNFILSYYNYYGRYLNIQIYNAPIYTQFYDYIFKQNACKLQEIKTKMTGLLNNDSNITTNSFFYISMYGGDYLYGHIKKQNKDIFSSDRKSVV